MSDNNTPSTIDLTPAPVHVKLTAVPDTDLERRGADAAYRVSDSRGKGIGYIRLYDGLWHLDPDGAERLPMRPELRDDAAWLLTKFRNGFTPRT